MKAIRFAKAGGPEVLVLHDVELPPPAPGQIRVRHTAIGVNFIDTYHRCGLYPVALPSGLGLEAAGTVEALGENVAGLKLGERVGYCSGPIGAYAEANNVPADKVVKLPAGVSDETFYGHWYGHQSPMSEWMQPRTRYVRNAVVRALTPGAPPYRAIVEEAWPSAEHVTDLQKFFGATDPSELGERIRIMLDSTKLLYNPDTMRNYTLGEYILKTP
jgi:hypothetical protein